MTGGSTQERLRAAIAPFAWGPGDEDEMLAVLVPVVDEMCREAAAAALHAEETEPEP